MMWPPPPLDKYKINMDGGVFKAQKVAGVGVLIWDCRGPVIVALSKKINAPLGPLESEAKVIKVGVQFTREIGIQDFIIEGDSLTVFTPFVVTPHPSF